MPNTYGRQEDYPKVRNMEVTRLSLQTSLLLLGGRFLTVIRLHRRVKEGNKKIGVAADLVVEPAGNVHSSVLD